MMESYFRDVTILHGIDGAPWCDYILNYFKRPNFNIRLHTVNVDRLKYSNPPEIEASVRESYVVMLLVSFDFITYMESNSSWLPAMLEKRDAQLTSILAATLSIDFEDLNEVCDQKKYSCFNWKYTEIETDGSNMADIVMNTLTTVDQNASTHKIKLGDSSHDGEDEEAEVQKEEKEEKEEEEEIYVPPHSAFCQMIPNKVRMSRDTIAIIFFEEVHDEVTLVFEGIGDTVTVTKLNPFCVCFIPPVLKQGTYAVKILVAGAVKEILQIHYYNIEFTSLGLMQQYFGAGSVEELDVLLAEQCRQSLCTDETLKRLVDLTATQGGVDTGCLYATSLHWAVANGLRELSSQLLMAPCAVEICQMKNCDGDSVSDLAGKFGHMDLKEYIDSFIATKQCADVCDLYMQACSLPQVFWAAQQLADNNTDGYSNSLPRASANFQERPYTDMSSKSPLITQISEESVFSTSPRASLSIQATDEIYEDMSKPADKPPAIPSRSRFRSVPETNRDLQNIRKAMPTPQEFLQMKTEETLKVGSVGCRSQNELIDILDEVKAGNFTIDEADMLFKAWKERYQSGNAVSFKEKQRTLHEMRHKYKNTLSLLTKATTVMVTTLQAGNSSPEVTAISEPVLQRKPTVGSRNKRVEPQRRDGSLRNSNKSGASFRSSNDSGCDLSEVTLDNFDRSSNNRRSLYTEYMELDSKDALKNAIPKIPTRQKNTVVYTKKKNFK